MTKSYLFFNIKSELTPTSKIWDTLPLKGTLRTHKENLSSKTLYSH